VIALGEIGLQHLARREDCQTQAKSYTTSHFCELWAENMCGRGEATILPLTNSEPVYSALRQTPTEISRSLARSVAGLRKI
jgi:hypothetical protein